MEHLNIETLARLVDEPASREEADHLAGCEACTSELASLMSQTESLAGLPDIVPPRGDWEVLAARLRPEGNQWSTTGQDRHRIDADGSEVEAGAGRDGASGWNERRGARADAADGRPELGASDGPGWPPDQEPETGTGNATDDLARLLEE